MMKSLDKLFTNAHHKKASDVHLVVGSPPIFRINGHLYPQEGAPLIPQDTKAFVTVLLTNSLWEKLQEERELDFSYGIAGVSRFRVNAFYQRDALSLAFLIIARDIPSVESLCLPSITKDLV